MVAPAVSPEEEEDDVSAQAHSAFSIIFSNLLVALLGGGVLR